MPVDSDSLGTYLRHERERRQVSLQDIAAATKIQLKFLEALEHDAYDQLPAAPFVVGFLRAYAQYMALDPEGVLTAYRSLQHTPEPVEEGRPPGGVPAPVVMRPSLVRLITFLAALGLVLGLAMHEFRRGQPAQSPVASLPVPLQPAVTGTPKPAMPSLPSVTPSETPVSAPAPVTAAPRPEPGALAPDTTQPVPAGAGVSPIDLSARLPADHTPLLVLHAKALEDTWLRIEIDGSKQLSLLLTSGKSIQWEANERFRLTIGNARGTRLALNGQDIPLQAGRGNVVRDFLLTRSSLQ